MINFNYKMDDKELAEKLMQFAVDNNLLMVNWQVDAPVEHYGGHAFASGRTEIKLECCGKMSLPAKDKFSKENMKFLKRIQKAVKQYFKPPKKKSTKVKIEKNAVDQEDYESFYYYKDIKRT